MRLLFFSNFYPPHSQGGYEQLCQEVAQAMAGRGHQVTVLTGRVAGAPAQEPDGPVRVLRRLELEVEGGLLRTTARLVAGRAASERRSAAAVEEIIAGFSPDAALVWGMWNVPRAVPAAVERLMPGRVAYYFCDYWPTLPDAYIQRFREPARRGAAGLPKRLLGALFLPRLTARPRLELAFPHAACVSYAIRDRLTAQGIAVEQATILRNGIRLTDYAGPPVDRRVAERPLRLVYAGRLSPEKGVDVAIKAVAMLAYDLRNRIELLVLGSGETEYVTYLRALAVERELPVRFVGFVPREEVPQILSKCHVLVFPSTWDEPLARTVVEAMAAGLVVVGTTTGGTGELLREGETGLTFRAGDAADLARQIERLAGDPSLGARLAAAGREIVLREFSIDRTVDKLEALLISAASPELA